MQLSKLTRFLVLLVLGLLSIAQAFGEDRTSYQRYRRDAEREDNRGSPTKSDENLARNLFKDADYEHFMEAPKSEIFDTGYLESSR